MILVAAFLTLSRNVPSFVGPKAQPLALTRPIADKNFYLLSLLHRDSKVEKLLAEDPLLKGIGANQLSSLEEADKLTKTTGPSGLEVLKFTPDQVTAVSAELSRLVEANAILRTFVQTKLRPSGAYLRFDNGTDKDLLAMAWQDCAKGLNSIVSVYGTQTTPARSKEIDSPLYTPKNGLYPLLVHALVGVILDNPSRLKLFFDPNLEVSVHLLEAQLRNEAARHEPMERGENRAAFDHIKRTNFSQFPYSVIVVPGEGPEESNVPLSPAGKLRIELAAKRYFDKKAPFILVSGGYVHPNMTPYSEAIEMKKSLIADFGVPEKAILVDPHARHTTTNLRNASRIIFRYGIPFTKKGLIVSDPYQSAYIDSKGLFTRNQGVFGFQPVGNYKRLSPFDLEFTPYLVSLSIDPADPLDP